MHDVHVEVPVAQPGQLGLRGGERPGELLEVERREGHAERGVDARDAPQLPEGLDLPAPAALDPADVVVDRLVAVGAHRDEQPGRPQRRDAADRRDDPVGEVAVRREVEHQEIRRLRDDRRDDLDDVGPQEDLAAGEVDPGEAAVLPEKRLDLLERELPEGLLAPDAAGAAAVVAAVRDREGQLVGEGGPPEVRGGDPAGELDVRTDPHDARATRCSSARTRRSGARPSSGSGWNRRACARTRGSGRP